LISRLHLERDMREMVKTVHDIWLSGLHRLVKSNKSILKLEDSHTAIWKVMLMWIALLINTFVVAPIYFVLVFGMMFGVPAVLLYAGWNWIVPTFGGPILSFLNCLGVVILIVFLKNIYYFCKKS